MTKYWLPWLVGMPTETALAICSVIFGGVLERCLAAHRVRARRRLVSRNRRPRSARVPVAPDLCAVDNAVAPRNYLGRFYVDSLVHDADALRFLVRLIGAERVALGSDYPFPLGESVPGELIESIDEFDAATKERLLGGTALEFLAVARERFLG
jgi:aminocarboxymuconate-semialdehyde decarboxylase